jgi:hypothetical protein
MSLRPPMPIVADETPTVELEGPCPRVMPAPPGIVGRGCWM